MNKYMICTVTFHKIHNITLFDYNKKHFKNKNMNSIEFRLQLFQVRSSLQKKGIAQPIRLIVEHKFWNKTKQDNNYLSGRIINNDFLAALKKLKEYYD